MYGKTAIVGITLMLLMCNNAVHPARKNYNYETNCTTTLGKCMDGQSLWTFLSN